MTQQGPLHALQASGQSIWIDSISRSMLTSGTLGRYVDELAVTGLTSNPTIFQRAIAASSDYDAAIRDRLAGAAGAEALFFELALDDIGAAADRLRAAHDASGGADGFASLEVSPALADDAPGTEAQGRQLFARASRPNVMIKVPGTAAGRSAVEALVAAGVPVNVTLLFDRAQYEGALEAYLRGLERRLDAGLGLEVPSVASLFVSRWDAHTASQLPPGLANRLGVTIAADAYAAYRAALASPRWERLAAAGARPQRLLWASTGTKDPSMPDTFYVTELAAPDTVNTMPEKTLLAFAERGAVGPLLEADADGARQRLAAFEAAGVDLRALAGRLQDEGKQAFVDSWNELLACLEAKRRALRAA